MNENESELMAVRNFIEDVFPVFDNILQNHIVVDRDYHGMQFFWCIFCDSWSLDRKDVVHSEGCAVLKARKLLEYRNRRGNDE